ncbi:MAG TPA: SPW repeat protein [Niastella sp.]|nr:SPW repeat protein [Niastella sp.]
MKVITRKTHGYLDYIVGALLIVAPWLLGFNNGRSETLVPVTLGVGTILYSILTDYELGAARLIPFRVHLTIDVLNGVFLAASPWMFGFNDRVYLPHLIIGLMELLVVVLTDPGTVKSRTRQHTMGEPG